MNDLILAAPPAVNAGVSGGMIILIAGFLVAVTFISQPIKWYHTFSLVFAGVLLGGLGLYPRAVGLVNAVGGALAHIAS